MVRLPQYFELNRPDLITQLPAISVVRYQQSQNQHRNEVYLTRHLIAFVLNGKKILHQNAEEYHVEKGEGIFIKAGCYAMSEIVPADSDFQSLLFFMDDSLVADFLNENIAFSKSKSPAYHSPVFKLKVTSRLAQYLHSVTEINQLNGLVSESFTHLKSMELFYQLLLDKDNCAFQGFLLSLQQNRATLLHTTMEQCFDKPLTLAEFAKLTARSLATFKRDFEKHYHTSPGKWIRERRLQKAYYLLRFTDKTVTEVCDVCGFENLSHFSQAYRKRFAFTPKDTVLTQKA
ncbi:helix-turn-helix transcriptional regulator [Pontibacter sp. MBLB2868]|uniref:helix-turn-helix transcriptional regulator n=1 Tax=Pontibacter sp. MBLB2868 TaxID=3451555 RepID=UPI003F74FEB8